MPVSSHQSVYKTTTTSDYEADFFDQDEPFARNGYLARTVSPGCCSSSRRKNQAAMLIGGVGSLAGSILLFCLGAPAGPSSGLFLALILTLAIVLFVLGIFLIVSYLRSQGRCNLPWWPNRAARLSKNLVDGPGISASATQPRRSGTETTFTDEVADDDPHVAVHANNSDERVKLMESDDIEAQRIVKSDPKIVLSDGKTSS